MKVDIRPAVTGDFEALGLTQRPYRVRAFTGVRGDQILGVGGLAFLPDGTVAAFVHVTEGARRYALALHRAGLMAMAEAKRLRIRRVVALAEDGVEPARRWLARLGFERVIVGGQEAWVWQD